MVPGGADEHADERVSLKPQTVPRLRSTAEPCLCQPGSAPCPPVHMLLNPSCWGLLCYALLCNRAKILQHPCYIDFSHEYPSPSDSSLLVTTSLSLPHDACSAPSDTSELCGSLGVYEPETKGRRHHQSDNHPWSIEKKGSCLLTVK